MTPARIEGFALVVAGVVVCVSNTTITSAWRSLRRHPVGLLAAGAATGALLTHLWLED